MRSSAAISWSSRTATGRRWATCCGASRSPRSELYPIPLEVCVADTQAGMGYMIAQCLANAMGQRNLTLDTTAIVTTVLVDRDDPAFRHAEQSDRPAALGRARRRRTARTTAGWCATKAKASFAAWWRRRCRGRSSKCRRSRSWSRPGRSSFAAAAAGSRSPSINGASCAASRR